MAILTTEQLQELRARTANESAPNWLKPQINAALQAIEDWFELPAVQSALSSAIDTATSPFVFPNPVKRILVKWWLRQRADRGN